MLPPPPPVLLILGTDAAGKDYVAEFLIRRWRAAGHCVEKRTGGFAAPAADARSSSERKGLWGRFQEQAFLGLFPLLRPLLPTLARLLLVRDRGGQPHRAAAAGAGSGTVPRGVGRPRQQSRSGIHFARGTAARYEGLGARHHPRHPPPPDRRADSVRHRYMLDDADRAEHIERCLVELATRYLNAALIENDDLDDAALERELEGALGRPARSPSP